MPASTGLPAAALRRLRLRMRRRHLIGVAAGVVSLAIGLVLWSALTPNPERRAVAADSEAADAANAVRSISPEAASAPSDVPAKSETAATDKATPSTTESATPEVPETASASQDEAHRKTLVGTWEQYRHGRRVLTVRDDGTATMNVAVDGTWAYVFGEKLRIEIAWSVENGRLKFRTTGGEPKVKLDLMTQVYGKSRVQPILQLDETRLVLQDEEAGEPVHDYKRIAPETAPIATGAKDAPANRD